MKLGAIGAASAIAMPLTRASASETSTYFALTIAPANVQMIDGSHVCPLLYFLDNSIARPAIRIREGDMITIQITYNDASKHGFAVPRHTGRIHPRD